MVDYFGGENAQNTENTAPVNGGTQQAATNGEDLGMAEISVSRLSEAGNTRC